MLSGVIPDLVPILVNLIDDKNQAVKDSTLHLLGILKGKLGDEKMSPFFKDIKPEKLAKIDEAVVEVRTEATNLVSAVEINQEKRDT